jgi:RHS repeat-associated protein
VTKVNGTTTLDQNRTHDQANEILTLTGTPDWPDPTHDAAGNMTKVPQPAAPTSSYDCKYDAWDRLVEVKVTGGAVVATHRYDGLKRRVTKVAGGNTRHYYYSNRWQVLEERLNALTTADRQFVWGIRHVDDLIERDRGSERFYVLHDHLSVTAVINTTAVVQERYGYDAFGTRRVMDANFGARSASLYDWETGFAAYRLDIESALCQVRHRYLHAKLGRWISRDPPSEAGRASSTHSNLEGRLVSTNLYWYVKNCPLELVDPSGLGPRLNCYWACQYACMREHELLVQLCNALLAACALQPANPCCGPGLATCVGLLAAWPLLGPQEARFSRESG